LPQLFALQAYPISKLSALAENTNKLGTGNYIRHTMTSNIEDNSSERLFWKFFANEATGAEKQELLAWLSLSEANKEAFRQARQAYIDIKHGCADSAGCQIAYSSFKKTASFKLRLISMPKLYAAASIAAAAIIAVFVFRGSGMPPQQEAIAYQSCAAVSEACMPDSSNASLFPGTSFSYLHGERQRTIENLQGEVFFDIKNLPGSSFAIMLQGLKIEVLGTSFSVETRPCDSIIAVKVISGKVAMLTADTAAVLLAGQAGYYNKTSKKLAAGQHFAPNDIAWKTGILSYEAEALKDVAKSLGKYFGRNIIVADTVAASLQLTAEFDKPKLESILTLLELALGVKATHTGGAIYLSGKE
jgi:transmembrane sensor